MHSGIPFVATLLCGLALLLPAMDRPGIAAVGEDPSAHGSWPFLSPVKPAVPPVVLGAWVVNPVDAFVLASLADAELSPNERADKQTLLRRVTLDLTGLPPSVEEQRQFLADNAPDAYRKVVDRLLASPAFGERWARHWLDVVRFAETEGFKSDRLRSGAHKYRDYVVRSFNSDRPYDEFVRQQLAGDQLMPRHPDALIATGLNRLYPDEDNAANLFQRRQEILDDVTETTGLAFLGLTMGCAQCHDHKFDDIPQADYFRLQAFFAPMAERDDIPVATSAEIQRYGLEQDRWEQATREIREEMASLISELRRKSDARNLEKFRAEIRECVATPEAKRTPLQQQIALMVARQLNWRFDEKEAAEQLPEQQKNRYLELEGQLQTFEPLKPEPLPVAMAISDIGETAPPTFLLEGGNWRKPRQRVQPGFPQLLIGEQRFEQKADGSQDKLRTRGDLAAWLTRKDHPLTARVIVNRIWHHYFGQGIVATPNDFGQMGVAPTHSRLLDWLAVDLVEHQWSLKRIHRLIVTSTTYCQSSEVRTGEPAHLLANEADGGNQLLWHARRRRLEGEVIRDAMLRIAGVLNRRMFGPSARPRLPEGISPRYAWKADENLGDQFRRSIYVLAKRNQRLPLLDVFDLPDMHHSCAMRSVTTTAPQALLMLNSRQTFELAGRWAGRLLERYYNDAEGLVAEAYLTAFGRSAAPDEVAAALEFLETQSQFAEQPPERVTDPQVDGSGESRGPKLTTVTDFCHAMFNANEFVYVD
jgi:hypothetical protein